MQLSTLKDTSTRIVVPGLLGGLTLGVTYLAYYADMMAYHSIFGTKDHVILATITLSMAFAFASNAGKLALTWLYSHQK